MLAVPETPAGLHNGIPAHVHPGKIWDRQRLVFLQHLRIKAILSPDGTEFGPLPLLRWQEMYQITQQLLRFSSKSLENQEVDNDLSTKVGGAVWSPKSVPTSAKMSD